MDEEREFLRKYNETKNVLDLRTGCLRNSIKAAYAEATMGHCDLIRYNMSVENLKMDFKEFLIKLAAFEKLTFIKLSEER